MLLARKELHNGIVKYLVRWAGEGSDQDMWIPECNLTQPIDSYKMTAEVAKEVGVPHLGARQERSLLRDVEAKWNEVEQIVSGEEASQDEELDEDDDAENIRSTSQGVDVVDADIEGTGGEFSGASRWLTIQGRGMKEIVFRGGAGYYPVAQIVDVRLSQTNISRKTSYKVRWKGYGPEADTWVMEDDLGASLDHYHVDPKVYSKLDRMAARSTQSTPQKKRKRQVVARQRRRASVARKAPKRKGVEGLKNSSGDENEKGEFWAVERLLSMRHDGEGGREFKVRWKNYSWRFDTWVKEEDLREAVHKFEMSPALRCHLGNRPKRGKSK
eukprot:evm.model.scf_1711.5 EVM.evm.TU.scf_1711.5   scf_1711:31180-35131(-)